MSETESNFMPAEGREFQGEAQEASLIETQETVKSGLLSKINRLGNRYPKIARTVFYIALTIDAFGAGALVGTLGKEFTKDSTKLELPQVTRARRGQEPTDEGLRLIKGLESEVGTFPISMIIGTESVKTIEDRNEVVDIANKFHVNGFEKFVTSGEIVEKIVNQTLPRGFSRNLASIAYRDYDAPMNVAYGTRLMQSSGQAGHASTWERRIEIVKGAKKSSKSWIAHDLIPHEVMHLQDWQSNTLLTLEERLELYTNIIDRVKSSDRFKSGYVEAIEDADKKSELDRKATEYFAEIGSTYLSPEFYTLPQADKDIIADLIAKFDPKFDRVKALQLRRQLIRETPPDIQIKTVDELVASYKNMVEKALPKLREDLIKGNQELNNHVSDEFIETQVNLWRDQRFEHAREWAQKEHDIQVKEKEQALKRYNQGL